MDRHANIEPLTKAEYKELDEVIKKICRLDALMKPIVEITKQRQSVVFKDQYRYMFLVGLERFFKKELTPCKTMIGCFSVRLNYCTVKIIRGPEKLPSPRIN
jgi:hypothetical protein